MFSRIFGTKSVESTETQTHTNTNEQLIQSLNDSLQQVQRSNAQKDILISNLQKELESYKQNFNKLVQEKIDEEMSKEKEYFKKIEYELKRVEKSLEHYKVLVDDLTSKTQ